MPDYTDIEPPALPDQPLKPKEAATWLRDRGLSQNQKWPLAFFESLMDTTYGPDEDGHSHESIKFTEFGLAIEHFGLHSRVRGGFVIIDPANRNKKTMQGFDRLASRYIRRSVVLGTNTDTSVMTTPEQQAHGFTLQAAERRLASQQSYQATERRIARDLRARAEQQRIEREAAAAAATPLTPEEIALAAIATSQSRRA